MKRITLLAITVLCFLGMFAQESKVQNVEGGFYVGPTIPLGGYHGGTNKAFLSFGASLSYNFQSVPVDCGVFMQMDFPRHEFFTSGTVYSEGVPVGSYTYNQTQLNRTITVGVVGNYNFRRSSKVNPFVGLGLGVGFNDAVGDVTFPSRARHLW